jgi:lipopolysaccharide transport system ATP-binding protein
MSEILIEAHGVGKKYHRGYFAKRLGKARGSDEFWALKDINLELGEGEALGIIGPNGAGKSTLLKILSRVTVPTEGWLTVRGRVGALIELGAGFHGELSGRDNVYIAGSILGMPRKEIARRFDEIVDFAEMGEYIDMPVKKYSSGMYVRLGFAVAAHMDPEILLVDEVLAVGDGAFQKKCFGAMQRFRRNGVAIILVSHSMYNIQRNCDAALLLVDGETRSRGGTNEVIAEYQQYLQDQEGDSSARPVLDVAEALCTHDMLITDVCLRNHLGQEIEALESGEPLEIIVDYDTRGQSGPFHAEVSFYDTLGNLLSINSTFVEDAPLTATGPTGRFCINLPHVALTSGIYYLWVAIMDETAKVRYDMWRGLTNPRLRLTVRPNEKSIKLEQWRGVVEMECRWQALEGCLAEGRPRE